MWYLLWHYVNTECEKVHALGSCSSNLMWHNGACVFFRSPPSLPCLHRPHLHITPCRKHKIPPELEFSSWHERLGQHLHTSTHHSNETFALKVEFPQKEERMCEYDRMWAEKRVKDAHSPPRLMTHRGAFHPSSTLRPQDHICVNDYADM